MQKPQVFFNLFINNASLLIVSIGMTLVIITGGIDLSVGGVIALTVLPRLPCYTMAPSPIVVMPIMLVMGILFRLCSWAPIIHFLKVQPLS